MIILLIVCLIGLILFFWEIYRAPTMDDNGHVLNDEDWLLRNEPNYLGQGRWK